MYDIQHAINVSQLSVKIGKRLGLNTEALILLYAAGLFHDIGKTGISERILDKTSALTPDEYEIVKRHTTMGHFLLSQMPDNIHKAAAQAALYHHERLDGSGYLGLRGDQIPLFARIIAVADVFDALVSNRPYREAWEKADALNYIRENTGSMFDAKSTAVLSQSL